MRKNILIVILIIMFIVPFFCSVLIPRIDEEGNIDRLYGFPTTKKLAEFPGNFDTFYNLDFPFKEKLVSLNTYINYKLFNESTIDKVIVGKDGWLFYNSIAEGDSDTMSDYYGSNLFTDDEVKLIANNLQIINNKQKDKGIKFILYIAPNKVNLYDEYLPNSYSRSNNYRRVNQLIDNLNENTDITVVYPLEDLLNFKNRHSNDFLYYATDTHWNRLGTYVGTQTLFDIINEANINSANVQAVRLSGKGGDLANMLKLSEFIDEKYCDEINVENFVINNKTLICGDSFSSGIRNLYSDCDSLTVEKYHTGLLDEIRPKYFVYEIVERNIHRLAYLEIND